MQVDELVGLHRWIDENVAGLQLQQKFAALHAKLQHNTRGQQQQPLEQERSSIQAALETMSFDALTDGQQEMLDRLGLSEHVGVAGVKRLEGRSIPSVAGAVSEKCADAILTRIGHFGSADDQ